MVSFSRRPSLACVASFRKGRGRELGRENFYFPATQATENPEQKLRLSLPSLLVQYVLVQPSFKNPDPQKLMRKRGH